MGTEVARDTQVTKSDGKPDVKQRRARGDRERQDRQDRESRDARHERDERAPQPDMNVDAQSIREAASVDRSERVGVSRARAAEHAVFLVPGLLGFERFASFSYFADRVIAALRAGLEHALDAPVPVVAVPISPTATLRERQRKLVRTLADRLHTLEHGGGPLQLHLVGHSTGGVDANLITCAQPIGGGRWSDVDPRAPELLARIRSVTSIASPHQGACIASDPVARVIGRHDLRGLPGFAKLFGELILSALSDFESEEVVFSALRESMKTYGFMRDVVSTWPLLADLQPSFSPTQHELLPNVIRRSFVTVAGQAVPGAGTRGADMFFRDLSQRATGWDTGVAEEGPLVRASVARLTEALAADEVEHLLIKADGTELPALLDAGHNDGVVNSARQLIDPSDPDELAGIVVGDHFDVVGYYDRAFWVTDANGRDQPRHVLSGLLHSGSAFRDTEFFELYERVARVIAQGITS